MNKRIIAVITAVLMTTSIFAACGDKTAETSAVATTVAATTAAETTVAETVAETSAQEEGGIPQPGDTYNGHIVDHTEDQPDCDDGSHGTIWVFYTDSDTIDYIEY